MTLRQSSWSPYRHLSAAIAGEADQAQGQPGSEKWVTWRGTLPRLEMWLREKSPWWDCDQRAADVRRERVQGVAAGETLLERDVLAVRLVHEGEEEQAVLGVVAAPEDR